MLTFRYSSDAPKLICSSAPLTSILKTSASTDASTSAAKVMVKYDEVDGGRSGAIGKSVKKLSKSCQKKSENRQRAQKALRSEKFAKNNGSEERLPKYQSSVNKELEPPLKL